MAAREGNVLLPPGGSVKAEYKPLELLAAKPENVIQKGRTILAGQGILEVGTLMARQTATKKWVKYASGGSGGAEVVLGVLRNDVDTALGDRLGNIVFGGAVLKYSVVLAANGGGGAAAAVATAITALNGRLDANADYIYLP